MLLEDCSEMGSPFYFFLTKIIWIYCFFFVPLQWDYCIELEATEKGIESS
jgi:hypothetical protein